MKLYLVRHGEAKPKHENPHRSLSDAGVANVRKVANHLSERCDIKVSTILHSGKARANETAELLGQYLKPEGGIEEVKGLMPNDDISPWVKRLSETMDDTMLVGHLPFMMRLPDHLLHSSEGIIDFPPAGAVALRREGIDSWSIMWMITPQII